MLRRFAVCLLMFGTLLAADEPTSFKLAAPKDWSGETIELPPGFAPDMKLKGYEHIRFAPGMMKSGSDTFFSYAFVFELSPKPELTEAVVKDEFLKYFRGLCKAVLNGKFPDVDPSEFTLELQQVKPDPKQALNEKAADSPTQYTGKLDWVEPFATKTNVNYGRVFQIYDSFLPRLATEDWIRSASDGVRVYGTLAEKPKRI